MGRDYTPEEAMADGRATARANLKAEGGSTATLNPLPEIAEDARETANLNHEADVAGQPENAGSNILKNDTSKKAKFETSKSQLNPGGLREHPTDADIRKQQGADMSTGGDNGVTNEENAERAKNPGKAEEEAPTSLSAASDGAVTAPLVEDEHAAPTKRSKSKARKS